MLKLFLQTPLIIYLSSEVKCSDALEFKIIKSSTKLIGYVDAKWKDILRPSVYYSGVTHNISVTSGTDDLKPSAVFALSERKNGIIKVENGTVDGPVYNNRWRKTDSRDFGEKLVRKLNPDFMPKQKAVAFKTIGIWDRLPAGYDYAEWKYVLTPKAYKFDYSRSGKYSQQPLVMSAVSMWPRGVIRVQHGFVYGPNYSYSWNKYKVENNYGHRLAMKLEWTTPKVEKPVQASQPVQKAMKFAVIKIGTTKPGYVDAEWRYVLNPNVYNSDATHHTSNSGWNDQTSKVMYYLYDYKNDGMFKVENGSIDGSKYNMRWRLTDNRKLEDKLVMKLPEMKVLGAEIIKIGTTRPGFVDAEWRYILKPSVLKSGINQSGTSGQKDFVRSVRFRLNYNRYQTVKVEYGSIDGWYQKAKWRKTDSNTKRLRYKLVLKLEPIRGPLALENTQLDQEILDKNSGYSYTDMLLAIFVGAFITLFLSLCLSKKKTDYANMEKMHSVEINVM